MICATATDYARALPAGGRLIGLDVGTKTIGTAFCDAGWHFATAAKTIRRRKFLLDKAEIDKAITKQIIVGIVIGLPLNMNGSDSPQTQSVRAFARNMAATDLPILLWDERWSTQAVERALVDADVSRAKRADRIDSSAAAYILQGALDALAAII